MANRKLGKPSDQRVALLRNQTTALLWNGKVVTTDRRGFITGDLDPAEPLPTVWPDAVPVIEFTHNVGQAFDPATSAFDPGPPAAGSRWRMS